MASFPDVALTAEAVIISGPPKTGEYRLFHELLAQRGSTPIVISTTHPADDIREHHAELVGGELSVWVVDCISSGREDSPEPDEFTRYVDSPGNLTAIGVKVTEFIEALPADHDAVVGLHSLSPLLMHAGLDQTYQFTHILAQQTAAAQIPFIAVVNDRAHDDQTINALYERFDCIVETRHGTTSHEYRLRTSLESTGWEQL